MRAFVHARHDDVAALDVADALFRRRAVDRVAHPLDPRPGGVDEHLGRHLGRRARRRRAALRARTVRRHRARAARTRASCGRGRRRSRKRRIHHVAHDEPRVVDARVGIDEALAELGLESGAPRRAATGRRRTSPAASRAVPRWSYRKRPARSIHAGRRCGSCGSTNDSGSTSAAPAAARPRARRAIRAPAGTRIARGSAGRRGSASCSTATWPTRCRPARRRAP